MPAGRVYLDYNAGAPLRPEARAAMLAALDGGRNASSVHAEGRSARRLIEGARSEIAALADADPRRVTFTSGGTEANVTVLAPAVLVEGEPVRIDRLLVGATEHASVLAGGRFEASAVETLSVDEAGRLDLDALRDRLAALSDEGSRVLVSLMLANNETGVIQPVAEAAGLVHAAGGFLHCDAVQGAGRIPLDIAALGADFLTLSAHKIGGPQGAGAIVQAAERVGFLPLLRGGGQERRQRAGTENVAAVAGFGAAARAAVGDLARVPEWRAWAGRIVETAETLPGGSRLFSPRQGGLAQTVCFGLAGVGAETLVIALDLDGIAVSAGAACSSGKVGPSHVLAAMGVPPQWAGTAIRVSMGWETAEKDIDMFAAALRRVHGRISPGGRIRAA